MRARKSKRKAGCFHFHIAEQVFPPEGRGWTKRCRACHMTGPPIGSRLLVKQEGLTPWKGVPLFFFFLFAPHFSLMRAAGIQRKQTAVIVQTHRSSNIWLPLERFAWHKMKRRRLEVGSGESCQRHSQHHTCSFFNHDQVLPILGNLNSKGCSASSGTSEAFVYLPNFWQSD